MKPFTQEMRIYNKLKDCKWHSNQSLALINWRFGGYKHALEKKWFQFEKKWPSKWDKPHIEYIRLVKSPRGLWISSVWKKTRLTITKDIKIVEVTRKQVKVKRLKSRKNLRFY